MLAQDTAEIFFKGDQGPGYAQAHRTTLAIDAAAIGGNDYVPLLVGASDSERLLDYHLADGIGEILGEAATIDGALAGTGTQNNARNGGFAATRRLNLIRINDLRSDGRPPRCVFWMLQKVNSLSLGPKPGYTTAVFAPREDAYRLDR
jgi:hypothetical protein